MKSQRRHELEQNVLAQYMAKGLEVIRPYINAILLAALLVVLGVLVFNWWTRISVAQSGDAWNTYFTAFYSSGSPADFEKVAEQYPRTDVGHWATITASDQRLAYACNQLFSNKAVANQDLRKAVDGYLAVLAEAKPSALRERATYGLARAKEAMGDLDEATKAYEEVVKQWPQGAFAVASKQRIDDLNRQPTKVFYDKFAKALPKPAAAEGTGATGKGPEFDEKSLPEGPAAKPGPAPSEPPKDAGASKPPTPGPAKPEEKAPPATEKPAPSSPKAVDTKK